MLDSPLASPSLQLGVCKSMCTPNLLLISLLFNHQSKSEWIFQRFFKRLSRDSFRSTCLISLLEMHQSAYRKDHSTETAVLSVLDCLLVKADERLVSLVVLLDLSAAFNMLDHSMLLKRLEMTFGVQGIVLEWFASYVHDRCRIWVGLTASGMKTHKPCTLGWKKGIGSRVLWESNPSFPCIALGQESYLIWFNQSIVLVKFFRNSTNIN